MMRYDARLAMEKELEKLGLYRGKENNKMRLGLCSRSGDIIEPMLTPQWLVLYLFLYVFIYVCICHFYYIYLLRTYIRTLLNNDKKNILI